MLYLNRAAVVIVDPGMCQLPYRTARRVFRVILSIPG